MTATTFTVTGLTCGHCVHAVTEKLTRLPGVADVSVELVPGGESQVTVMSDDALPADAVTAALDEAGDYRLGGR
jgi:copper chaperone